MAKDPLELTEVEHPTAEDHANRTERDVAYAIEQDREAAAQHLEHLAATVYEGQTRGALNNAANDLRAGAHIKPEPEAEVEAEAEAEPEAEAEEDGGEPADG